jgi:hypothetical protein
MELIKCFILCPQCRVSQYSISEIPCLPVQEGYCTVLEAKKFHTER